MPLHFARKESSRYADKSPIIPLLNCSYVSKVVKDVPICTIGTTKKVKFTKVDIDSHIQHVFWFHFLQEVAS